MEHRNLRAEKLLYETTEASSKSTQKKLPIEQEEENSYKDARKFLRNAIKQSKRQGWKALRADVDRDLWGMPYRQQMYQRYSRLLKYCSQKKRPEKATNLFWIYSTRVWKEAISQNNKNVRNWFSYRRAEARIPNNHLFGGRYACSTPRASCTRE